LTNNKLTWISPATAIKMAPEFSADTLTAEQLPELLKDDLAVKVAGIDVDGMLRGKLMAKKKFLSIAKEGFGFCSVIFGWDMHDQTYFRELAISNKENGYRDLIAVPDLSSFRRIPWEDNVPFFLISFYDPDTRESLSACPRSLLKRAVDKLKENGYGAMAGGECHSFGGAEGQVLHVLCKADCLLNSRVRVLPIPRTPGP
jgi:glutamine synthetase